MDALKLNRQPGNECGGILPRIPNLEEHPAVYNAAGDVLWTRADLRRQAEVLAYHLASKKPQLTFLIGQNAPASLVAFLASLAAGNPVALIDHLASIGSVKRLLSLYEPDLVLGSQQQLSALELPVHDLGPNSDIAIWKSAPSGRGVISPELALLLSTSGTTGSQKFVRLSDRNLVANANQIAVALDITPADIAVAHLPLHYSYGLSVVTSHLRVGAGVHLWPETITVPEFWAAVSRSGGTHFPGVPYHYNFIGRGDLTKLAPPSLRTFTQAGGALDTRIQRRLIDQLSKIGGKLFIMYGQTEASPRITTLPFDRLADKLGSVGKALDGGALSIVDENDRPVAPGQSGRVMYQGPNVMLGYAESRADLCLSDQMGGHLMTGDLGRLDAEGYLFLTGREKRIAKLYGLRISLDEVEARFRVAGDVAALEKSEKIILFTAQFDAISQLVCEVSNEYKIPSNSFSVRSLDALPLTTSGKIDYSKLDTRS
jgi:acyl-CoA synthetase (AMP-forming)/AMP-acid ligase II